MRFAFVRRPKYQLFNSDVGNGEVRLFHESCGTKRYLKLQSFAEISEPAKEDPKVQEHII